MIPSIRTINQDVVHHLFGVFFDIDDTFTTKGKIPAASFDALWRLKESGFRLVPITGRPAGWCDHIARMWPVDGVVGENGAFYFWMDEDQGKLQKRFLDSDDVRKKKKDQLTRIRDEILLAVPGAAVSSDQSYRETDLAIDFTEDVPRLGWEDIEKICRIFTQHGAQFKVSSIHVNGWFGSYDKLSMTRIFVSERWNMELDSVKERFFFCGDSPNDEPMFEYFPYSAGVRNILQFAGRVLHLPTFIAESEGGQGFAEIADILVRYMQRQPSVGR
ncbi:MAG: HAD-IIB family hydrolase [Desulfomonilia bacterium]